MEKKIKIGLICFIILLIILIGCVYLYLTYKEPQITVESFPEWSENVLYFNGILYPSIRVSYPKKVKMDETFEINAFFTGSDSKGVLIGLTSPYFIIKNKNPCFIKHFSSYQGWWDWIIVSKNESIASAPLELYIKTEDDKPLLTETIFIEISKEHYEPCTLENNCVCLSRGRSVKGNCFHINTSTKRIGPKRSNCSCFEPVEINEIKLDFVEGYIISDNELNITIKNTGNYTLVDVHIGICTDGGAATYSIYPPKVTLKPGDIQSYRISGCSISDRDNRIIILHALEETYSASVNFPDLIIQ